MNPLYAFPLELRHIKSVDEKSKEYKKALHLLRIRLSGYLMHSILNSEYGEVTHSFKRKYKTNLFLTVIFIVLMIGLLTYEIIASERRGVYEFTPYETMRFAICIAELVLTTTLSLIFAFRARGVMDKYLASLIRQTELKCSHFSDDVLSQIALVYALLSDDDYLSFTLDGSTNLGCYSCFTIFRLSEQTDTQEFDITCPNCHRNTVVPETEKITLSEEFLSQIDEYQSETRLFDAD